MKSQPWWRITSTPEERRETITRVLDNGGPSQTYFILLVLATLIAAYGLVSDSSATVIGAMIVAPLMGPILGLALATVRADSRTFNRALSAEATGVVLVVAVGVLVAVLVSPDHIDYAVSTIAGRIRPTLYDMAIGLAAGLAGAYCTVHPRLQGGIAGVAVAVALVPPLTVTGLTLAGALYGQTSWSSVLGSFVLFVANFLTIEIAATVVFLLAGLGELRQMFRQQSMVKQFGVQMVLLLVTGAFLGHQLDSLLLERHYERVARQTIDQILPRIKGSNLEGLSVNINAGQQQLTVRAVVSSRQEVKPSRVAEMQRAIDARLVEEHSPLTAVVFVRTTLSFYADATNALYEPPEKPPDPQQVRHQALEAALRQGLLGYPGAPTMNSFLELSSGVEPKVQVTLISPYRFGPRLVARYQQKVDDLLAQRGLGNLTGVQLVVRSLTMDSATAEQALPYAAPDTRTPQEQAREKLEQEILGKLKVVIARTPGSRLLAAHLGPTSPLGPSPHPASTPPSKSASARQPAPQTYRIHATVEGPRIFPYKQVLRWQKELVGLLAAGGSTKPKVVLQVDNRIGTTIRPPAASRQKLEQGRKLRQHRRALLTDKLRAQVATLNGGALLEVTGVALHRLPSGSKPGRVDVTALVMSPHPVAGTTVRAWERGLAVVYRRGMGQNCQVVLRLRVLQGSTATASSPDL